MKVMLVDDHPLFLEGLENLLTSYGIEVVGTVQNGRDALAKAHALHPDVILMDIYMSDCDGLAATRLIKKEMPQIKIVMLTASAEDEHLHEAIKCGASGYLLKNLNSRELLKLLEGLSQGEAPLSPVLAGKLIEALANHKDGKTLHTNDLKEELTSRQIEILKLVSKGLSYKEVGATLFLSERTIKYHMGNILIKLDLQNRNQAIAYAVRKGLII
ncbi:MAG: response regulator transcription factor [Thermacetogeniaceae bacterium]